MSDWRESLTAVQRKLLRHYLIKPITRRNNTDELIVLMARILDSNDAVEDAPVQVGDTIQVNDLDWTVVKIKPGNKVLLKRSTQYLWRTL